MPAPTVFPSPDYWTALAVLPPAPLSIWAETDRDTFLEWADGCAQEVIIHLDHTSGVLSACWYHWVTGEETEFARVTRDAASFRAALVELWSVVTDDGTLTVDPGILPILSPVSRAG